MPEFETITLRAPAGTKTAWVRQARGQKLSAWALAAVARGAALDAGDTLTDTLTDAQFDALAELLRLRSGLAVHVSRLVLVGGLSVPVAAKIVGMPYQRAWQAVQRTKAGLKLARAAGERCGCGIATEKPMPAG